MEIKPKIIDAFTYHNEADLLELRLNILDPYVDEFVIVESTSAFSGFAKPLFFEEQRERFAKWLPKIKYYVNKEEYTQEEIAQARESDNTGGVPRWIHEFLQKEQIQKALTHLNDEDIVFVGDVDEVWFPSMAKDEREGIIKLQLLVYTYFLNQRSDEVFWGCIKAKYKDIKGQCLNHLRNNDPERNTPDYCGWHFTSQGGLDTVKKKLVDQYNSDVFGELTHVMLEDRFGHTDYIGRDFKFWIDESQWPEYLKENKEKYSHLLK